MVENSSRGWVLGARLRELRLRTEANGDVKFLSKERPWGLCCSMMTDKWFLSRKL